MSRTVPLEQYEACQDCLMKALLAGFQQNGQILKIALEKAIQKGIVTLKQEGGESTLSVNDWKGS